MPGPEHAGWCRPGPRAAAFCVLWARPGGLGRRLGSRLRLQPFPPETWSHTSGCSTCRGALGRTPPPRLPPRRALVGEGTARGSGQAGLPPEGGPVLAVRAGHPERHRQAPSTEHRPSVQPRGQDSGSETPSPGLGAAHQKPRPLRPLLPDTHPAVPRHDALLVALTGQSWVLPAQKAFPHGSPQASPAPPPRPLSSAPQTLSEPLRNPQGHGPCRPAARPCGRPGRWAHTPQHTPTHIIQLPGHTPPWSGFL